MSPHPVRIGFDRQIFCLLRRGGISRYFSDLITGLEQGAAPDVKPVLLFRRHANHHLARPDLQRLPMAPFALARRLGVDPAAWPSPCDGVDVLHATYYLGAPQRPARGALVSTLHDMTPERLPEHFPAGSPHGRKREWFERSDRIVSVSASSAADLIEQVPHLADRIRVIHLGTGLGAVSPRPPAPMPQQPFLLHLGRRERYKNLTVVLEALARLGGTTALVLVGGGPLRPAERRQLAALGLGHRVRALAADDCELAWLYRHCRAVVVPSLAEGFSLPLIEALACDAPVLASAIPVHREVAGDFATLLDPGRGVAWCDALVDDTSLPRPHVRLGPRAWGQRVIAYGLPRMVADHGALYRSLL
jgi:glycosyltransferase involved in cell wall biosynthesis